MPQGDTAALLKSIRRHTHLPSTHPDYSDEATLGDATEELHSYILPLGMGERQELWAGPTGRALVTLENGRSTYPIPGRAVGAKLRAVRLLGPSSESQVLNWYGREDTARMRDDGGMPTGLVVEGATFRLFPTPRNLSGWRMEVDTYVRPGELVPVTSAAPVAFFDAPSGGVTNLYCLTASVPLPLLNGLWTKVDVVSSTPPFDARLLEVLISEMESGVGGGGEYTRVAVDAELSEVVAGDWLAFPGQSPVVQAPLEWHPLLALKVATKQLGGIGDMDAVRLKGAEGGQKEKQATTLIRPRREDVARKVGNGMDRWRGGY